MWVVITKEQIDSYVYADSVLIQWQWTQSFWICFEMTVEVKSHVLCG